MENHKKDNKSLTSFIPLEREEMRYHEYMDYWVCKCGNFEKLLGFNASDKEGNLVSPFKYVGKDIHARCERCGRVIEVHSHTIIGINTNPNRGSY